MKNNKLTIVFISLAVIITIIGFFGIKHLKNRQVSSEIKEYIPQEEVNENQLRKTMVNLYFYNNETGELEKEARLINSIELLEDPYKKLIEMLIDGPKSEKLSSLMPEELEIIKTELVGECVTVDMSIEFLNYTEDNDLKNKMINSIVNTLTELTEVESVKFLINGEENDAFNEKYTRK